MNELAVRSQANRNPALVYWASLSKGGRPGVLSALRAVARDAGYTLETMPWEKLRYEHVQALRTRWQDQGLAPATINLRLSAIRGVMREAWRLGLIDGETYQRIADVPGVRGSRLPAGRHVGHGELYALFEACADGTPVGVRDAAILALAYAGGLRRAEIVALRREDVTLTEDGVRVTVVGKGNKQRAVYLDNGGAQALRAWLDIRGDEPGPLFWRARKGGRLERAGMTPQAVRLVLQKRAQQARVAPLTPHDLRRSCVSDMLDAGVDIATVARHVGHASVKTTQRYDRRGDQALRQAARSLHVPYLAR